MSGGTQQSGYSPGQPLTTASFCLQYQNRNIKHTAHRAPGTCFLNCLTTPLYGPSSCLKNSSHFTLARIMAKNSDIFIQGGY